MRAEVATSRANLAPVKKLAKWLGEVFPEGPCRCHRCLYPEAYPRRRASEDALRPHTLSLGGRDHRRRFAISTHADVASIVCAAFAIYHKYDDELFCRSRVGALFPNDLFCMLPPELWERLAAILFETGLLLAAATCDELFDENGLGLSVVLRLGMSRALDEIRGGADAEAPTPDEGDDNGASEAA